jgi:hypothetical protein
VEYQHVVEASDIFHSSGKGGAELAEGSVDFDGRFLVWGHTPTFFPTGDNRLKALAFTLSGAGTNSGLSVSSAACTGLDIVVPTYDETRRNGVYYVVYFGAAGVDFSAGGATPGAAGPIFNVKGLGCTFASTPQANVQKMHLAIRNLGDKYVDSSTNGVFNRPDGPINWRFNYRRGLTTMADAPALNAVGEVIMYVETAKTWILDYGRVIKLEQLLDPQSGEVIGADIAIGMCTNAGVVGSIKDPTGPVWNA